DDAERNGVEADVAEEVRGSDRGQDGLPGEPDVCPNGEVTQCSRRIHPPQSGHDLVSEPPLRRLRRLPRLRSQRPRRRSEEHTSELQSRFDLVCRLLLEKKKYS